MTRVTVKSTYQVELSQRQLNIVFHLLTLGPDTDEEINELYEVLEEHATRGGGITTNQDPEVVGPLWEFKKDA